MNIKLNIGNKNSIKGVITKFKKIQKQIPKMKNELLYECCVWVRERANEYLNISGLNPGFINEIKEGWQPITKQLSGSWLLTNFGRAYSVEFGIGIKGEGTYEGSVPPNYEYNVKTRYKSSDDGSWIFKVDDINTLDIKQENVLVNKKTGELVYEEGKSIRTNGQKAVMFCYQAIVDFKDQQIANKLWEQIKEKYWG